MKIDVVSTLIVNENAYKVGDIITIKTKQETINGKLGAILHNKIVIMEGKMPNWVNLENIIEIQ